MPADADTTAAGHQVSLTEGDNTITATVTDGSDSGSYTVTVTRVAPATLTVGNDTVVEGGTFEFPVSVDNAVPGGFTVTVSFSHLGASPATYPDQTLTFVGGCRRVPHRHGGTIDDALPQSGARFVNVSLEASLDAIDDSDRGRGRLVDNDSGVIAMDNATAAEGEDLEFEVRFNAGLVAGGFDVTLSYAATARNGATSGTDYTPYTETLSFDGTTANQAHSFTVAALTDSVAEGNERFRVTATPSKPGVPAVTATGTITNVAAADTTAPTVTSIERHDGTSALDEVTNADTVTFRVTFSETVEGVDTADFTVTAPGGGTATTATATNVTGSGTQYVVTVSTGNLASYNGAVGLDFASGQDIKDEADNALTATLPTGTSYETYTLDNTAPTATLTAPASHDGSTAFDVAVVFSEDVTGFSATADVTVNGGTASIASTDARNYTVTVTPSGTDDVTVLVPANAAEDAAGNGNALSSTSTVDHASTDTTAPTVTSIERHDGTSAQGQHTNADSLTFRVTFSETVENVGEADFTVTAPGGGTATTATATNVSGSGTQYVVTVSSGNLSSYEGTVGLGFATDQDISDGTNTLTATLPSGTSYQTYTLDNTVPTVMSIKRDDGNGNDPGEHTNADTVKFRVTISELVRNLSSLDFKASGTTGDASQASVGDNATVIITITGGDLADLNGAVGVVIDSDRVNIEDQAGNELSTTLPAGEDNQTYTIDNAAPTPALSANPAEHDGSSTSEVTVNFSEAVNGFAAADIGVTGGAKSGFSGSDGDSSYTVTLTPTSGSTSDMTVTVAAGAATDLGGQREPRGSGQPDGGLHLLSDHCAGHHRRRHAVDDRAQRARGRPRRLHGGAQHPAVGERDRVGGEVRRRRPRPDGAPGEPDLHDGQLGHAADLHGVGGARAARRRLRHPCPLRQHRRHRHVHAHRGEHRHRLQRRGRRLAGGDRGRRGRAPGRLGVCAAQLGQPVSGGPACAKDAPRTPTRRD